MPFKSSKQRAYLFSQKPDVAKKYSEHGKKSKKKMKDMMRGRSKAY
jgi:hypothetical protein